MDVTVKRKHFLLLSFSCSIRVSFLLEEEGKHSREQDNAQRGCIINQGIIKGKTIDSKTPKPFPLESAWFTEQFISILISSFACDVFFVRLRKKDDKKRIISHEEFFFFILVSSLLTVVIFLALLRCSFTFIRFHILFMARGKEFTFLLSYVALIWHDNKMYGNIFDTQFVQKTFKTI